MSKPSEKHPILERQLESMFGRTTAIEGDTCVSCQETAAAFKDDVSQREYLISGLCQRCQDQIWGDPDDDEHDEDYDEDDGQPDEQQEWYDYDPDC